MNKEFYRYRRDQSRKNALAMDSIVNPTGSRKRNISTIETDKQFRARQNKAIQEKYWSWQGFWQGFLMVSIGLAIAVVWNMASNGNIFEYMSTLKIIFGLIVWLALAIQIGFVGSRLHAIYGSDGEL